MSDYLATQEACTGWIKGLANDNRVFFPEKHGHASYRFNEVGPQTEIQFEHYTPTVVPPVKLLLPAEDELLRFKKSAGGPIEVTASLDMSSRILAGVRPCDLKGISLMDLFFTDSVTDPYYLARREHTAIIGLACSKPCGDNVFCAAVESLDHRDGADVFITPVAGGEWLVEAKTPMGEKLLDGVDWQKCDDGPARKVGAVVARPDAFGRPLKAEVSEIPKILNKKWKSPVWDKHVARCFSCGTCNLVCPTCYCFDVLDDLALDVVSGHRTRTWDACMLPHFAMVAGGHNFRPEPAARQRHRVKRKFEYLTEKYKCGAVCVGCGRCGRQCTSHIDIYDIVNDLIEEGGQ